MVRTEEARIYEAITPEELYRFDEERGYEFTGPTVEEVLEWDELTAQAVNDACKDSDAPVKSIGEDYGYDCMACLAAAAKWSDEARLRRLSPAKPVSECSAEALNG
jgi:hypothetical protein